MAEWHLQQTPHQEEGGVWYEVPAGIIVFVGVPDVEGKVPGVLVGWDKIRAAMERRDWPPEGKL